MRRIATRRNSLSLPFTQRRTASKADSQNFDKGAAYPHLGTFFGNGTVPESHSSARVKYVWLR
jgi:hypothetical protein